MLKKLFVLCLTLFTTFAAYSSALTKPVDSLSGYITLNLDFSALKDTAGIIKLRIGGETFYPKMTAKKASVKFLLKEPRRSYLAFYPRDTVNKYQKHTDYISLQEENHYQFFSQPGEFNLQVGATFAETRVLNESKYQKDYALMIKQPDMMYKNIEILFAEELGQIQQAQTKSRKDSLNALLLRKLYDKYQPNLRNAIVSFIAANPDSPVALQQLDEYSGDGLIPHEALAQLYGSLTERIKKLPMGVILGARITNRDYYHLNLEGKQALDFKASDPNGKPFLSDFGKDRNHKFKLLLFGASWCAYCKAAYPGLKQVFEQYKSKGFTIVEVSLDTKKEDWLHAIKRDQLPWLQVSDLQGAYTGIGKLYSIAGIPDNFLIDQKGVVVAKRLSPEELGKYLANALK